MEEILENSKRIKSNITFLAERTTNIKKLMILLVKKDVISHSQLRAFMKEKTDLGKLFMLYASLSKTVDNRVFGVLIEELNRSGNEHIFDVLVPPDDENARRLYFGGGNILQTPVELDPNSIDPGKTNQISQSCALDEGSIKQKPIKTLIEQKWFSLSGYYGSSLRRFIKFEPSVVSRLLMIIEFEKIEFKITDLINALRSCEQLEHLTLDGVNMTGKYTNKVHLPRLKVFRTIVLGGMTYDENYESEVSLRMERVSFFYKDNSMKNWKFSDCNMLNLDHFSIAYSGHIFDINHMESSYEYRLHEYGLDEILQSPRFAPSRLILGDSKVSIKSLIQIGSCLTRLIMNCVDFIDTEGCEIDLSKAVLRYLPQLELLQVHGCGSKTSMSINTNHLPPALTGIQLSGIKLLYISDESEIPHPSLVANNSSSSHKMRTLYLQGVALPLFDYEIEKLFGQIHNIFINGSDSKYKPSASFLDKLVKIDSIQLICIYCFDWESIPSGGEAEFSSWLHAVRIPEHTKRSGFALARIHRENENEKLWRGKELDSEAFDSLFTLKCPSRY